MLLLRSAEQCKYVFVPTVHCQCLRSSREVSVMRFLSLSQYILLSHRRTQGEVTRAARKQNALFVEGQNVETTLN